MFTLLHLNTPPAESLKSQLLQMVVDYFSDLSPLPLQPSNASARLLLALADEDPLHVLGFALYLPCIDDPQAATLLYLAVNSAQRRQGIGRALLKQLRLLHPHLALACVPNQVAMFRQLGFQVLGARGPQVLMNSQAQAADGWVAVQDLQPIFQSREVRQIHTYLLKQHGSQAMRQAERQRDRLLDQLTRQALTMAEHPGNPPIMH